jgi:hypothetical protein
MELSRNQAPRSPRQDEKYGFFDEKMGDHPYSLLNPLSAIL